MYTLCALHFDDGLGLAERLWQSLGRSSWARITDVRVGLNGGSDRLRGYLFDVLERIPKTTYLFEPLGGGNAGKYPLMRHMFYDFPVRSWIMWFDDDSYVTAPNVDAWFDQVAAKLARPCVLGSKYTIAQRGRQWEWIRAQPWFAGKEVGPNHRFTFCTGGWWVADPDLLSKWSYPWPQLHHNGGDSLLGELCRQQGVPLIQFRTGVAINADAAGTESAAPRRGLSVPWPGQLHGKEDRSSHRVAATVWRKQAGRTLWEHFEFPA